MYRYWWVASRHQNHSQTKAPTSTRVRVTALESAQVETKELLDCRMVTSAGVAISYLPKTPKCWTKDAILPVKDMGLKTVRVT